MAGLFSFFSGKKDLPIPENQELQRSIASGGQVSVYQALNSGGLPQKRSSEVSNTEYFGLTDILNWERLMGIDEGKLNVNASSAMSLTAFSACLDLVSSSIAQVPFGVYKNVNQDVHRWKQHAFDKVFSVNPSRHMNNFMLRKTMVVHLYMYGHCVVWLKRDNTQGNRITEFKLLQPEDYSILNSTDGYYFYELKNGTILQEEDVFHIRGLSLNGFHSKGLQHFHKRVIQMGLGSQEYLTKYYKKGTIIDGYLSYEGQKLSPENRDQISDDWDKTYGGLGHAFSTPVLGSGTKYNPITRSPVESQLVEFLQLHPSEIYRMFRVPPHLVGDTTKSTSFGKGIEDLSIAFVTYTLLPIAVQIESEWNRKGFRESEYGTYYVKHNFSGLMRGDYKTRMEGHATGIQNGIYSPNEVRRMEETNGYEQGDVYLINGTLRPVNQAGIEFNNTETNNAENNVDPKQEN